MKTPSTIIATLFGIGYSPKAPGTLGSVPAALFVWLVRPSLETMLLLVAATLVIGTLAAQRAEVELGQKDSQKIVVDELAGCLIALIAVPPALGYVVAGFVLFRFFDIFKPPPIGNLQALTGGIGVMADDVAAGVLANAILQIWRIVFG